jgi:hypothetical protein
MKIFPLPFMYCSNLSCKFSRQTQKKLVGFSHYGHFSRGSRFAANFIQNLYTVLKKRLWESRSTPTLEGVNKG